MKFYILVKNNIFGDIKSEIYKDVPTDKFDQLIESFSVSKTMEFFDENGNYVFVPEATFNESLIYLMKVK